MESPHPLKMSVAHLTHIDSTVYEVELRIFIDDLIVGTGGRLPETPTPWSEVAPKAKKVSHYVQENLEIRINDLPQVFTFERMDVEELAVACYMKIASDYYPEQIYNVAATNTILVQQFSDQRNVLHVELPGKKRRSLLFNIHSPEAMITLE